MFALLSSLGLTNDGSSRQQSVVALHCEALEAREVPASLYIGEHQVLNNRADYIAYIKYLTVPEEKQSGEVFTGNNVAAIRKLEDPLQRQIFNSMYHAPSRQFNFPNRDAAEKNVELRVDIVHFMNMVSRQTNDQVNTLGLHFGYWGTDPVTHEYHAPTANPAYWSVIPADPGDPNSSRAFRSKGNDAYAAIMSIPDADYYGECYGTIQIAILYSAAAVLDHDAFNALFPNGLVFGTLNNWNQLSVARLLPQNQQNYEANGDKIGRANMVPGDWVYMKNKDDYDQKTNHTGYWSGENAIYMGRYDRILNGQPVYNPVATPRFTGLGEDDKSERQMRLEVWKGYCVDVLHYSPKATHFPPPNGVRWTVTVGPGTSEY